jgi:hypothetical protein
VVVAGVAVLGLPRAAVADTDRPSIDEPSPLPHRGGRMFGIFPDGSAIDRAALQAPLTTSELFVRTASHTFDPVVFPMLGVTAAFRGTPGAGYQQRYLTAVADNALGNFMTSAIAPALFHQDPRYVASDRSGTLRRAGYALSRSVVIRSQSGHLQINVSELGGNAAAAGLSNLYYSPADRTVTGTLTRWGSQVLWNCVSNEMKEFWPDIRQRLARR